MTLPSLTIPNISAPKGARKVAEIDVIRNIDYHNFQRVRVNGNKGTLFTLSTDRNVETLRDHSNIITLAGHSQHAPEQRARYLFVSDKRFI